MPCMYSNYTSEQCSVLCPWDLVLVLLCTLEIQDLINSFTYVLSPVNPLSYVGILCPWSPWVFYFSASSFLLLPIDLFFLPVHCKCRQEQRIHEIIISGIAVKTFLSLKQVLAVFCTAHVFCFTYMHVLSPSLPLQISQDQDPPPIHTHTEVMQPRMPSLVCHLPYAKILCLVSIFSAKITLDSNPFALRNVCAFHSHPFSTWLLGELPEFDCQILHDSWFNKEALK